MNIEALKVGLRTAERTISKHAPAIFTGLAVISTIAIIPTAINGTIKAIDLVDNENKKRSDDDQPPLDKLDTVATVWKCYIPAGIAAGSAIFCCVAANRINAKRIAGLAAAYTTTNEALKLWKEKTKEVVGEKKTSDISAKVSEEQLNGSPFMKDIVQVGKGDVLCMDSMTGQLFYSSVSEIDRVVTEMNKILVYGELVSVNDLNYQLGIRESNMGDMVGWSIEKGMIHPEYDSVLTKDNTPCLVVRYSPMPYYRN